MSRLSIVHPFLFALFPVLTLYAHNRAELSISEILLPAVVSVGSAALLLLLLWLLLKDVRAAGIIVSIFLALFFSYGYVDSALETRGHLFIADYLLPVSYAGVFGAGVYLFGRARASLSKWTAVFNVVAVFVILVPSASIGVYEVRRSGSASMPWTLPLTADWDESEKPPDIYYIILDSYASSKQLSEQYEYDNSVFEHYLRERGFYVASESRSNYCTTYFSLASSLNMDFLDSLVPESVLESQDYTSIAEMVRNNRVVRSLKSVGYRYVHFDSPYSPTHHNAYADLSVNVSGSPLSPFLRQLAQCSLLRVAGLSQGNHRSHVLGAFDELGTMPQVEGPKFVFAHIVCPHWPFVFDAEGNAIERKDWGDDPNQSQKWLDQISFVNKKVEVMVDQILATSTVPPIIILQGDHGSRFTKIAGDNPSEGAVRDAMRILNALYLPRGGHVSMYQSISPVNTFRAVLSFYFGADLPFLGDESYYCDLHRSWSLVNVTDKL